MEALATEPLSIQTTVLRQELILVCLEEFYRRFDSSQGLSVEEYACRVGFEHFWTHHPRTAWPSSLNLVPYAVPTADNGAKLRERPRNGVDRREVTMEIPRYRADVSSDEHPVTLGDDGVDLSTSAPDPRAEP